MWKALILALALTPPGAAAAQQLQQPPSQSPPPQQRQQPAASRELIKLHDDLRLSSDQEQAWRAYTTAIAPSQDMQARHRSAADMLPLEPTPRRIALIAANLAADEADFKRRGAAVLAFYNQLTPSQQQIFDRETAPGADAAQAGAPVRRTAPSTPPR